MLDMFEVAVLLTVQNLIANKRYEEANRLLDVTIKTAVQQQVAVDVKKEAP